MATERYGRDVWEPRVRAYRNSGMTQKKKNWEFSVAHLRTSESLKYKQFS